jgi:hypothetical protein
LNFRQYIKFNASADFSTKSTALLFKTGRAPGRPIHIGQTFTLGSLPKQLQNNLVSVESWACTSRPIDVSSCKKKSSEKMNN